MRGARIFHALREIGESLAADYFFFVGEAFSLDHRGWKAAPAGSATFRSKYILCATIQLFDELLHSQCTRNGLSLPP